MIRSDLGTVLVILLAATCVPVRGATDSLEADLRRCAQERESTPRLACFDALVSKLPQLDADRVGMTAEIERRRSSAAPEPAKDPMLSGKITGLQQAAEDQWIFTLDNRQVWEQSEPKHSIRFAVGETVYIEHGAMDSLWLVGSHNRKVRVRRLQ
jgi:hypothetical protein